MPRINAKSIYTLDNTYYRSMSSLLQKHGRYVTDPCFPWNVMMNVSHVPGVCVCVLCYKRIFPIFQVNVSCVTNASVQCYRCVGPMLIMHVSHITDAMFYVIGACVLCYRCMHGSHVNNAYFHITGACFYVIGACALCYGCMCPCF